MPAYAYTGLTAKGRTVKGIETADNVGALRASLKRMGVYLTAVSETTVAAAQAAGVSREVDLSRLFDRVTPQMVAAVTRLLGTLLSAGVTLPESLRALTEQVESARFKGILSDIAERVNEGSSLADALAAHPRVFPPLYVNMVRAGEASGALETVLGRMADFMDKQIELRSKLGSAMIYPIVMTVLGAAVVTLLMVKVVPQITAMFEDMNAELPWNTKALIFVSDAVTGYWYLIIAGLIGGVYLFRYWRRTEGGQLVGDRFLLTAPVLGDLMRKIAVTRMARTLSTMLASGVQLLEALDIVRTLVGNVVLERVIRDARDNIREGEGIAPALKRSGEFPPLVTHMIAVGERSGQLEQMLNNVATTY
jgi:general secretion pathway protein F